MTSQDTADMNQAIPNCFDGMFCPPGRQEQYFHCDKQIVCDTSQAEPYAVGMEDGTGHHSKRKPTFEFLDAIFHIRVSAMAMNDKFRLTTGDGGNKCSIGIDRTKQVFTLALAHCNESIWFWPTGWLIIQVCRIFGGGYGMPCFVRQGLDLPLERRRHVSGDGECHFVLFTQLHHLFGIACTVAPEVESCSHRNQSQSMFNERDCAAPGMCVRRSELQIGRASCRERV